LQREEVSRQKKEMMLMERMANAEADRARLAEKMKYIKDVMEERRQMQKKGAMIRMENEADLKGRMEQAEHDKTQLTNQLKYLQEQEQERKQIEYDLLQKIL